MNILLTGATGFIGKRLAYMLKERRCGDKIILLTSEQNNDFCCVNHKNYTYDNSDFQKNGVDFIDMVMHVGSFVPKNNTDNFSTSKNLTTTVNTNYLLNHLPNIPKTIIFASTTDVYGRVNLKEYDKSLISEDNNVFINNAYNMAKYQSESLVVEWAKQNDVVPHILRFGSIYGVGDKRENFFINNVFRQAASGIEPMLYANPATKRNYLYVDDLCKFVINSMDITEDIGAVNLVSSSNPTMLEWVQKISEVCGIKFSMDNSKEYTGVDLAFDASKREKYLGNEDFNPFSGGGGIEHTVGWLKQEVIIS